MTSDEYKSVVLQAKEHILAGDIFQIVLSQCFERRTFADPFEIYRALRVVNPSPYMTYLQNTVVNQPLAGTVRRGRTPDEDTQLEKMLLGDEKQCAEHIMLVTVELLDNLTCWDALSAALPVGTVSGAPKVKAMELIDKLEVTRRGPYSGGFGWFKHTIIPDFSTYAVSLLQDCGLSIPLLSSLAYSLFLVFVKPLCMNKINNNISNFLQPGKQFRVIT
ncbi:putative anthranilate synthase [Helianthus annuus]|nr:putative anthranilate synthase [Helianthus annuus]KAJ0485161.1 putative anthranilate synthase [Helianthus annuus]KAJ0655711.1 putative anthranilate synthase [Helianthus annuus]KAJ0659396.1 putative anthranilate synthase [Helianthus annuus]KAJ0853041.1 putative anthranilate synthase [Helianthus annuus]